MPEFPASPIPPTEFLESWFPAAYAEAEAPPGAAEVDVKLGLRLEGEGGGEWLLHMDHGSLQVHSGSREEAAFTYVQSVDDWRGALWEGRGGALGKGTLQVFDPGRERPAVAPDAVVGPPAVSALAALAELSGLIRLVVDDPEHPWSVGLKLGPGEIPEPATTTVSVTLEDVLAIEEGELEPMAAFMSGRIRVDGDMTLMMQMQAVLMQAAQGSGSAPS